MKSILAAGCIAFFGLGLLASADIPLKLERFDGPDSAVIKTPDGVIEVHGAASLRVTPNTPASKSDSVLELEYFCVGSAKSINAIPGPPFDPATARLLPGFEHSETWSSYTTRLNTQGHPLKAGWKELRLEVPLSGVLQIRNARLRPARAGEFDAKPVATGIHSASTAALEAYLSRKFGNEISSVTVGASDITITGTIAGDRRNLFLGDIPMETLVGKKKPFESLIPLKPDANGGYSITVPRTSPRAGLPYDRLTSRWQLVRKTSTGYSAASPCRYADEVFCRSPKLPPAIPKSKKGLGGWAPSRLPGTADDLTDLGIAAITVNIFSLTQFVALTPEPDTTPFAWQGHTYYAREKALAKYDRTFLQAEQHGAMVSAILLVDNPLKIISPETKLLGHPDVVAAGKYAMPNVTSPDGIAYYGAILNLLAERWSRDDGIHGRVHHWIVHNEVDFGWIWTNAGKQSDIAFMDLYQRSMRLIQLIARQYDPNARAFISLTHHWAQPGNEHGYGSKRMLDLLTRFCKAEGDFPWGLAFHPYPQSLFNPRTWEDDLPTFDFNSPKITPRNLEVLDAYMKLPALRYRGEVRPVHLAENGFNSKDYSAKSLEDQAAGMAMAWKKIAPLSSIESWQYHNWIDGRWEGGLRIGLRKFPDDPEDPFGKKPIWHLYQALGTPQEDAAAAPYLKTIGIGSWEEIIHRSPIQ